MLNLNLHHPAVLGDSPGAAGTGPVFKDWGTLMATLRSSRNVCFLALVLGKFYFMKNMFMSFALIMLQGSSN